MMGETMADSKPENRNGSRLDHELDTALAKYAAAVEPRDGFETRILANLQAAREREARRPSWRWVRAAVAVVAIVVMWLVWRPVTPLYIEIAHDPTSNARQEQPGEVASDASSVVTPERSLQPIPRSRIHRSKKRNSLVPADVVAVQPKLDQFPSLRPLSEQERMLADYVAQFPADAALVARAQTALRQREELDRNSAAPGEAAGAYDQRFE
jgi:hypothetical protein